MSYRAFKRLLGETSLERKCRFLFGAFILLAHHQQLLALRLADGTASPTTNSPPPAACWSSRSWTANSPPVAARSTRPAGTAEESRRRRSRTSTSSASNWGQNCPAPSATTTSRKSRATPRPEQMPSDNYTLQRLKEFLDDPNKLEDNRLAPLRRPASLLRGRAGQRIVPGVSSRNPAPRQPGLAGNAGERPDRAHQDRGAEQSDPVHRRPASTSTGPC